MLYDLGRLVEPVHPGRFSQEICSGFKKLFSEEL